jgi:maleate isomerase
LLHDSGHIQLAGAKLAWPWACHLLRKCPVATAALRALEALDVNKLSFVGPCIEEVTDRGRRCFEQNGYRVTGAHGMVYLGEPQMSAIPLEQTYDFTKRVVEPDADAVFIRCTALSTVGAIEALEADLGKPVVSAIQATF